MSTIRIAGCGAVLGGFANLVADYLLRGGPAPVAGADITMEALATVPFESVFVGSILGAAAIPLWLLGLWPVYRALEPAGRGLALGIVLLFGYGIVVASGYHGTYAFHAVGYQALEAVGPESRPVLVEMMSRFRGHHDAHMLVFVVPWVAASFGFVVVVLFFRTHYARWMAVASPILVPITMPLVAALPSPVGGWVRPIHGTTIWTLFFLLTTIVTWRLDRDGPGGGSTGERASTR
ncbi:MAG: hypothetical protein QNK03_21155 [Myxococcota bacterium]|nr:hypothetical protein [Myxococcota bacterium]